MMSFPRDIDVIGYPLPIDPVTGMAWWRFNLAFCGLSSVWSAWQADRRMDDLIPVLRWLLHGSIAPVRDLRT